MWPRKIASAAPCPPAASPLATRVAAWVYTGPLGHLYGGLADWAGAAVAPRPRARAQARARATRATGAV